MLVPDRHERCPSLLEAAVLQLDGTERRSICVSPFLIG